jgi:hypothetical protein
MSANTHIQALSFGDFNFRNQAYLALYIVLDEITCRFWYWDYLSDESGHTSDGRQIETDSGVCTETVYGCLWSVRKGWTLCTGTVHEAKNLAEGLRLDLVEGLAAVELAWTRRTTARACSTYSRYFPGRW